MHSFLPLAITALFILAFVQVVAPRIRVPSPVLLAILGMVVSFLPFARDFRIDPAVVLVGFLPPLLYADAFKTSWVDFKRWLRPILMLAVLLVAITILAVGVVAHAMLPTLPWPVCFVLGAIVSPTDTVAVSAVIERLRVPRRMTAILGGESLVNDATGLVGVQIGVAVILSGTFSIDHVGLEFLRVAGLGIAIGAGVGFLFAAVNRLVCDTPTLFVLSLLSPYFAFLAAEQWDVSGVLAVVVAGFVVAWRIHQVRSEARVELYAAWELFTHVLNGLCFVFIGLATPYLISHLRGAIDSRAIVHAGLAVSLTVVVTRIVWCIPNSYLPLWLFPGLREREGGYPAFRNVLLVSWCGVRGVVSLAAALALPETTSDGSAFPGREEVIACTLGVIIVTLIGQGLTLGPLIRLLRIRADASSEAEQRRARETALEAGIARLDEFCSEVSCPISVHHLRTSMADELTALRDRDEDARESARLRLDVSNDVKKAVLEAERAALLQMRDRGEINDRTYMDVQLEIDRAGP